MRPSLLLALLWLSLAQVFGCAALDESRRLEALWEMRLDRSGGGEVQLSEYRGKVLLLDLFATWSQPSMVAIPRYAAIYRRHEKEGLAVVGIALDDLGERVVAPFLTGMQIPYPVALADADLRQGRSALGDVTAVPTLLIFDRYGELVQVFYGLVPSEAVEAVIRRLF